MELFMVMPIDTCYFSFRSYWKICCEHWIMRKDDTSLIDQKPYFKAVLNSVIKTSYDY